MKTSSYSVTAIQTELFGVGQDLSDFIVRNIEIYGGLKEGSILAVTSKIFSLAEKSLIAKSTMTKRALVEQESDVYLGEIGYGCHLTVKHGLLIPSAGIDESNSESGEYILFPKDPFESCSRLHAKLRTRLGLEKLGIIMTDSHTTPLRQGVTGIALAYWGIRGTRSFVGKPDLFGRAMQMTQVNIVDALAAATVLAMGESNERRPLAIVTGAEVQFVDEMNPSEVGISIRTRLIRTDLEGTDLAYVHACRIFKN